MFTERNCAVLHRRLTEVVGDEEAVSEMLSNVPNTDQDRPTTAAILSASEAGLRSEMHALGLRLILWIVGTAFALAAVILAAIGIWA